MNRIAFRIAASTAIVATTLVGFTGPSVAMRRLGVATVADSPTDRQASRLNDQARRALQQGQYPAALQAMEEAVALSPRDAGYRLLLADIYMKSGRFESARATYADVLELDPSSVRAGLGYALMQVALGRPQAAVAQLDALAGRAAAADVGLAYALAGQPERAIEILEPAARGYDATPRLRQNLALAYALAGDWARARTVGAQDVSPADLGPRLQQWAAMARPDGGASARIAGLLGVTPVQDAGQPIRLALAVPAPAPAESYPAYAAAPAPAESYPAFAAAPAPAESYPVHAAAPPVSFDPGVPAPAASPAYSETLAEAEPLPQSFEAPSYYLPPPAPEPERSPVEMRYAAAVRTLTRPEPAVVRAAAVSLPPAPAFRRAAPRPEVRAGDGRFVVQLGAFSNEANAERAWLDADRRFDLGERVPLTTTFQHQGKLLHRVSIAGFASRGDAARMCEALRGQGGACFVRETAGDASVRWAARYADNEGAAA